MMFGPSINAETIGHSGGPDGSPCTVISDGERWHWNNDWREWDLGK